MTKTIQINLFIIGQNLTYKVHIVNKVKKASVIACLFLCKKFNQNLNQKTEKPLDFFTKLLYNINIRLKQIQQVKRS